MRKTIAICIALLMLLPLTGCGVAAEDISVMATFYPVYVLAENVLNGVEGVSLTSMTPPATGCLHDYQLLTSDMKALAKAQALLVNGAGMESFLPDLESQFPALRVIDCSQGVELMAESEEHGRGDHDHGEYNAHIWLDPQNAVQMVNNLRDGLSALLPEHAGQIAANAESYIARLRALDAELREAIEQLPGKQIVTFHEAFPYFAKEFGLNIIAVVEREPGSEPTPNELQAVIQQIKPLSSKVLFTEPQYAPSAAQTIARETGAKIFTLDPVVTGESTADAMDAYLVTMRKNMATLQEALQ